MIFANVAALVVLVCIVGCAWPIGSYVAKVVAAPECVSYTRPLRCLERCFSSALKGSYAYEMTWREYFFSFFAFHSVGCFFLYIMLRWQSLFFYFDAASQDFSPYTAFNIAVSFVTNTNWQAYVPEVQMSAFSQAIGLTVQQFFSASAGATVMFVLARAIAGENLATVGNFWRDLIRFSLYVLLPLSIVFSVGLIATGVPQTMRSNIAYRSVEGKPGHIPVGMCASQTAIKQLGTNGGGFYNANSAHPLENPTPLSNLLELCAILLLPAALCRTFGVMVGSERQGYLMVTVMGVILCIALSLAILGANVEYGQFPFFEEHLLQSGGNMEGKECRFGSFWSIIWSVATTATANGSVNCSLSSLMPLVGGVSLGLMEVGEVVYGGIGTGMTGAVAFLLIAVFTAGLMVGRTPEYLGKKIEATEMKLASLMAILPAILALVATAIMVSSATGLQSLGSKGPHGMSGVLYAFSSSAGNNGSSFADLNNETHFCNVITAIVMYLARFFSVAMILALASSLGKKKKVALSVGTLSTETVPFGLWFCFVIIIIGALNFLPAFTLGPILEHLFLFYPISS